MGIWFWGTLVVVYLVVGAAIAGAVLMETRRRMHTQRLPVDVGFGETVKVVAILWGIAVFWPVVMGLAGFSNWLEKK